ncbi:hypothetical protein TNCV_4203591 [Trichonephila clavipes]|uniref:Uncharacterized protein n=1 Tax=Trichonephila clavipes TaxID=2585209 RepID=A0A8X6VGL5_TRICX|nr:hypothetical protein TNCV_4203591 [Trichonephila clavipes]
MCHTVVTCGSRLLDNQREERRAGDIQVHPPTPVIHARPTQFSSTEWLLEGKGELKLPSHEHPKYAPER